MSVQALRKRINRLDQARPQVRFTKTCICFPANEQPALGLRAEREAVASVLCPLHGKRFTTFRWPPFHSTRPGHWKAMWKDKSAQYRKAMKASFRSDRWPAVGTIDQSGILCLVLKDGTQIQRAQLTILYEDNNQPALSKDGRPMFASVPNASLLGPPLGSNELAYITEDDECRYCD